MAFTAGYEALREVVDSLGSVQARMDLQLCKLVPEDPATLDRKVANNCVAAALLSIKIIERIKEFNLFGNDCALTVT